MPTYTAPVDDTRFVLEHLADLQGLAALPGFDEATPELVESVLAQAARMAAEVFAPINAIGDRQGVSVEDSSVRTADGFGDAYCHYREAGWLGLAQDPEHGGQGLPFALHMAVSEYWNAANLSLAICPMLSAGAAEALTTHATPALREIYLPKLISAEWTGTMCLSEPQAGSDLAAVKTQAKPSGDEFRITGQKIFISWGDHDFTDNILHLVLARLPDAPAGVKGVSLFLVPKFLVNADGTLGERNNVVPVSVEHKIGIHASPTCVMSFGDGDAGDDNAGAIGYLVGEANNGIACMFTMMNHARLEVGLEGVGIAHRAYQAAVRHAHDRKQGRVPGQKEQAAIILHPDVRRMLLLMRALTEAGRALALVAAATHDRAHVAPDADVRRGERARLELLTPIVKAWCTEFAQEVTSLAVQVHGGMGYVEETGVGQFFRDARITPIYEGTSGIQSADLVGRKVLRDGGAAMGDLVAEIRQAGVDLAGHGDTRLAEIATKLAGGVDLLEGATSHLLESGARDPASTGAAAFNYLMLCGTVVGGWLMARSAVAAAGTLRANGSNAAFAQTKITTTAFYMHHVLPRALTYAAIVKSDATLVTSSPPESFE